MKELSIEEKAKRYDSMFERLKEMYNNNKTNVAARLTYEKYFPELKESEDERVRNKLIEFFKGYSPDKKWWGNITQEDILAWLEKQGEQKPDKWNILSAKKGDMLSNGTIVLIVDSIEEFEGRPIINSWYFADSEKFYGKGTSECDRWEVNGFRTATEVECNYLLKMMSDVGYVWNTNKLELMEIEQNLAWSEEDNAMIDNILGTYKTLEDMLDLTTDQDKDILESMNFERDWIMSLKCKVQPKQEWSNEDEQYITDTLNLLSFGCSSHSVGEVVEFLKSIKDRVRVQSQWKPSDEQIEALDSATENCAYSEYQDCLRELIGQLKKLKE